MLQGWIEKASGQDESETETSVLCIVLSVQYE